MKASLPIILLAAVMTLALVNRNVITRDAGRWSEEVQQADSLAQENDWAGAETALKRGYKDWKHSQTYLHIVIRHEELNNAESMYLRAEAFAKTRELSEFRAELAGLRNQLQLLAEMERISIKNVL